MTVSKRAGLLLAAAIAVAGLAQVGRAAEVHCERPPPPLRDLDVSGYYTDSSKSVVDATALRRKRAAVKPLNDYLDALTRMADRAVRGPRSLRAGTATCAVRWLRAWAAGGGYLGPMASKQAQAQRQWDLAGLALAYLKVRTAATAADRAVIEPWLHTLADRVRATFEDPGKRRNNHWYWTGLGLGAVATATGSARHWAEARRIMRDAAADIGPDGRLARELARGRRALHYHTFSAMPLVVLAELGHALDEDFYRLADGALHRLVSATAAGLADPTTFDRAAGVLQQRPVKPRAGWLQLYTYRFPDRLPRGLPRAKPGHRWIGGNTDALRRVLAVTSVDLH